MAAQNQNFFTRLFARKQQDEVVVQPELDESKIATNAQTLPHTLLALTPEQEAAFPEEVKVDLQKRVAKLPPINVGEFNFVPFEAGQLQGGYYVKVFIRNGRDVSEEIGLEQVPLHLVDASGEKVASGLFRVQNFGTLKFGEARFWSFAWRADQIKKPDADFSRFTVEFE
ncbi:SLAP domain-containing protein [Tumebacillus permanentifrigoris]|uniref:SLAP domain-containing protein n=1 Tax=Tumebacillus permanentifrigoris TaxID=378543 RepID=A0A316DDD1_9BACL|nr:SLAP domain-containing protein [Tumebacillus permanentifrigoris]PWK16231.1 SLAP domain-containing protein [Tumebacillus permanentifrigoris]